MSQNLVEQLAARRRARGQKLNSSLLAVIKEKEPTTATEQHIVIPPKKVFVKYLKIVVTVFIDKLLFL